MGPWDHRSITLESTCMGVQAWSASGNMGFLQPFTLSNTMRHFMNYKEAAER